MRSCISVGILVCMSTEMHALIFLASRLGLRAYSCAHALVSMPLFLPARCSPRYSVSLHPSYDVSELRRTHVVALAFCRPSPLRSMSPPSSVSMRQSPVLHAKAPASVPHQARTSMTFRMFIPGTNVLPLLRRAVAPSMTYSCDTPEPRLTHAFPLRLGAIVPACHDATRRHGGRNTMHSGDARISQQSPYAVLPLASTTAPIPLAHVMRRDSDAQDVVPYPLAQFGRHPR